MRGRHREADDDDRVPPTRRAYEAHQSSEEEGVTDSAGTSTSHRMTPPAVTNVDAPDSENGRASGLDQKATGPFARLPA